MRIIVAHGADESIDGPKGRRKTDVQEVADVLRNLSIRDREKGLSAGEKRMIQKARQILISELSYATGKTETEAETVIDGRESQAVSVGRDAHLEHCTIRGGGNRIVWLPKNNTKQKRQNLNK